MKKLKVSMAMIIGILATAVISSTVFSNSSFLSEPTHEDVLITTVDEHGENFDLKANVYLPHASKSKSGNSKSSSNVNKEPTPLVLFIHGHGGAYDDANGSRSYPISIELANQGIAVATIDYRYLTGLPENVYDTKAYVRYFRAHAEEYNIDPDRIAVWGTSRGGHLASMLATTGDMEEFEGDVGGNLDQSSSIQAAVIYYPFTDAFLSEDPTGMLTTFYGIEESKVPEIMEAYEANDPSHPQWDHVERIQQLNPINHVSEDDPPALITIGGKDFVTPLIHSTELFNKYIEVGAEASLYAYAQGGHGTVGTDIEEATTKWLVQKLLVELAPKDN
ncbi:alpha/beta hydrolase fold domain-containing protein [Salipaludibacillus sp. CF4.18]|uniref:alpha/beta hydrolase fold domain-containing protein n=1 Tax=Salipaludibacillus sp. CF4.18 TaxID=3373081 RepID=UPI003EE552ED